MLSFLNASDCASIIKIRFNSFLVVSKVPENKQVMRRQQTIKQELQASCATVQAMSPAHSGHMLLLFGDELARCGGNNFCKNVARTVQVTQ
jgi:hypothetical protein